MRNMADKFLVKEHDGTETVHWDGPIQPNDVALCGSDLMGDNHLEWEQAVETNKKVDCRHCLRIAEYCRTLPKPRKLTARPGTK